MNKAQLFLGAALLLAGAILGQTLLAGAQTKPSGFQECFAATVWTYKGADINGGEQPRKVLRVPAGWTVVGGAQYHEDPAAVLCR